MNSDDALLWLGIYEWFFISVLSFVIRRWKIIYVLELNIELNEKCESIFFTNGTVDGPDIEWDD